MMNEMKLSLEADLCLTKDNSLFLSAKTLRLLENIIVYGSISKAAKASDITYKTAWAWIDKMNALTAKPLFQRISGGKGGGGTIVTAYAKELMCRYEEVNALHEKHLLSLSKAFDEIDNAIKDDFIFSRLKAEIIDMAEQDKKAILSLKLGSNEIISAQTPIDFLKIKNLKPGSYVSVLIESESVSVSKSDNKEISSRNRLNTHVKDIIVNGADVLLKLEISSGEMISAQITHKSYKDLKLKKEDALLAIFKAYSITVLDGETNS